MLYLPAPLRGDGVSVTGVKVVAASVVVADVQENHKKTPKNINSDNDINLGNIQLQIFSLSDGVLVRSVKRMDSFCIHTLSYSIMIDQNISCNRRGSMLVTWPAQILDDDLFVLSISRTYHSAI